MNEKNIATMICSVCGEEKELFEFPIKSRMLDSRYSVCRVCKSLEERLKSNASNRDRYNKLKELDPYIVWARNSIIGHKRHDYIIEFSSEELADIGRKAKNCAICGCDLKWNNGKVNSRSPAVDSVNNEINMTIDNIQIACLFCNTKKAGTKMKDYVDYCKKVVEHQGVYKK